ncbi:hypothetical protein D187_007786 [Cystobacter fuscus DSM 2262]|uniref:Uncharacterized protein n=1 Tax=Cystobacter fuscus (strain ATCC 25194 / DSM 2262 / NBRC 100088 / M29) TaxID=1242864 RepID=S9Q528_CYSF2|nr:hypothetical protein D187_007786 [Cystobacter fuscus DSM 2262]
MGVHRLSLGKTVERATRKRCTHPLKRPRARRESMRTSMCPPRSRPRTSLSADAAGLGGDAASLRGAGDTASLRVSRDTASLRGTGDATGVHGLRGRVGLDPLVPQLILGELANQVLHLNLREWTGG